VANQIDIAMRARAVPSDEDKELLRELGAALDGLSRLAGDVADIARRTGLLQVPLGLRLLDGSLEIRYSSRTKRQESLLS
jgi:hypothetical protein